MRRSVVRASVGLLPIAALLTTGVVSSPADAETRAGIAPAYHLVNEKGKCLSIKPWWKTPGERADLKPRSVPCDHPVFSYRKWTIVHRNGNREFQVTETTNWLGHYCLDNSNGDVYLTPCRDEYLGQKWYRDPQGRLFNASRDHVLTGWNDGKVNMEPPAPKGSDKYKKQVWVLRNV
ncbi:RICIN domain-containing protein [Nonomuraea lactucae]|uniref:RICIN domain-containing protein n=1 Tax=Nonomuraea lactucae TaxID=2249762 RepID=UPI0013B44BCF|nr:RICIN domain-containing protein [Nonomuraea lactucae]